MVENLIYWYFALAVAAIVAAIAAVLVGLEMLELSCQCSG